MNLLDRAILALSPARGLARVTARAKASVVMNYDAASKGRRTYGWKAPGTAADSAAVGNRGQLRNLSRDMIRNRPFAARAQMVVAANVVGTGISPSVVIEDAAKRDRVADMVRLHLLTPAIDAFGEHGLPALQRIVINTVFSDGEVLVRRRIRDPRLNPGLPLPFQVQLMEADYLDQTLTAWGQNVVSEGVEIGPTGRIEAYHLYDTHPGDMGYGAKRSLTSRRVPASEILHIRRCDRPGQLRGVPWLAPVMMTLGELSDYQEAQILKQRMAALMAAVVTSEEGADKFTGKGLDDLAPGAVIGLAPGQDVKFTDPPLVEGYSEFMKQGLAAVAMGVGITTESLSGDLKGVNFSSGRMGRMEMDRLVESWQQLVMVDQFCDGVARWFADAWGLAAAGAAPRFAALTAGIGRDEFRLQWTAPRRALIDPTREIPAMIEEVEGGLSSRQRQQRRLGYDPDVIRRERVEDADKDKAASLPPPAALAQAGGHAGDRSGAGAEDFDPLESEDLSDEG